MRVASGMRAAQAMASLVVALLATSAGDATAQCGGTQLCGAGTGDCTVSSACTITLPATGLDINLGTRRLVVNRELRIEGPAGAGITIRAGDFLLDGASILAPGVGGVAGNITILSNSNLTVRSSGAIDASGGIAAGLIDLEALGGDISITGRVSANGTGQRGGFGGVILLLAANNVTITGSRVDAPGGDLGGAGNVTIEALSGAISVGVPVKAFGADGGDVEISAGTTIQTLSAAEIDVDGTGDAGAGGTVDISAPGNITLSGNIIGTGAPTAFRLEGRAGGDGGNIDIFSDIGNVSLNGTIDIKAPPGGFGGSLDVVAGGSVSTTRPIVSSGDGADGGGGDAFFTAGTTMSLGHTVDMRGSSGTGGTIDADVTGNLTVSGSVMANGDFMGGTTTLTGCAVNLTSTGSVSSRGPGAAPAASNVINASSTMTIAGSLQATTQNILRYRQAPAPSITGPAPAPAATLVLDGTLPCCLNCPVTTTTTSTTTTRPSTTTVITSTTTTLAGNVCGNGVVGGSEQCDDGNTVGGDCCSATCTFEASGAACANDGNVCTLDICNGVGACTHPVGNAGATCRAAAGTCDQAEACTGTSATCPADTKRTTQCRGSFGPCDVAENCDGVSNGCPADGFVSAATTCRAAAGTCDRAETCTGTSAACPVDQLLSAGTVCRATAGSCDVTESCTGSSALCPADQLVAAGTTCRAAAGVCDLVESCTGSSASCPANGFVADGTTCGAGGCTVSGTCQSGVCSGGTPVTCDPCETCNPLGGGCVPAPKPACLRPVTAGKSRFRLKDSLSGPGSDFVRWKWAAGAATTLADFGNPVTTDDYTLCVFDQSQATSSLVFRATVPAGGICGTRPCWLNTGRSIRFKSLTGQPEGGVGLSLVPGAAGNARLQFKGKGTSLSGRPGALPTPPLPVPLTVQLQAENGSCWEANYVRAGVRANDGQTFDGADQ